MRRRLEAELREDPEFQRLLERGRRAPARPGERGERRCSSAAEGEPTRGGREPPEGERVAASSQRAARPRGAATRARPRRCPCDAAHGSGARAASCAERRARRAAAGDRVDAPSRGVNRRRFGAAWTRSLLVVAATATEEPPSAPLGVAGRGARRARIPSGCSRRRRRYARSAAGPATSDRSGRRRDGSSRRPVDPPARRWWRRQSHGARSCRSGHCTPPGRSRSPSHGARADRPRRCTSSTRAAARRGAARAATVHGRADARRARGYSIGASQLREREDLMNARRRRRMRLLRQRRMRRPAPRTGVALALLHGEASRGAAQAPSARAMTICWTSSVPSPIVRIFASR